MILKRNKLRITNEKLRMKSYSVFIFLILNSSFLLESCKIYSFSGTTLSPDLKTINVQNALMGTAGGPANMSALFTEKLKNYYTQNSNLKLKPTDSDLILESTIVGYDVTPVSATSGDKAASNRLTIRVEVRFTNNKKEDDNFEKEFSFYKDFPQEQTLADVQASFVPKILDQIVQDMFNATAAQW